MENDMEIYQNESRTNLIVNYLPQSFRDSELYSMFITIGRVLSCKVMMDKQSGYSYGFGFVNYENADDAARAIDRLNGLQVGTKTIKVSFARPPSEEIKETNLYITHLPRNITEEQLEDMFGKFGNIVQKNLLRDKLTGMTKGVAFVRYNRREEASAAIQEMNGVVPRGGIEKINVKVAAEYGKQKRAFYAGFHAGQNHFQVESNTKPKPFSSSNRGYGYRGAGRGRGGGSMVGVRPPPPVPMIPLVAYPIKNNKVGPWRQDKSHPTRFNPFSPFGYQD